MFKPESRGRHLHRPEVLIISASTATGKRSDIYSWDLTQSVPEPRSLGVRPVRLLLRIVVLRQCFYSVQLGQVLLAGGKRSDIDSWDLIASIPEPRSRDIDSWDLIASVPEPRSLGVSSRSASSSDRGPAPMFLFWFCDVLPKRPGNAQKSRIPSK